MKAWLVKVRFPWGPSIKKYFLDEELADEFKTQMRADTRTHRVTNAVLKFEIEFQEKNGDPTTDFFYRALK